MIIKRTGGCFVMCLVNFRSVLPVILVVVLASLVTIVHSTDDKIQPPRFVLQPSSTGSVVNEGQTKILQCQAAPSAEYLWMKDGEVLGNSTSDPFLRMKSVDKNDAGEYRCIARNSGGAALSEKIRLVVAYMTPMSNQDNETIEINQGDAAILKLPFVDSKPIPTVTWLNDDDQTLYEIKFAATVDDRLVILDSDVDDARSYYARITNTQVGVEEKSGWYRVVVKGDENISEIQTPSLVVAPENVDVVKGTSLSQLQCIANGRPLQNIRTTWTKDGIAIEKTDIAHSFDDTWNRTLTLINLDATHSGTYQCHVTFLNSKIEPIVAAANVTVLVKPHFDNRPPAEMKADLGRNVLLPCQSTGNPKPNITWYHNAQPITTSNPEDRVTVQQDCALYINNVQLNDSGIYQCVGSNMAGEAFTYTWLQVKIDKFPSSLKANRVLRKFEVESLVKLNESDVTPSAPRITDSPLNLTVYDGKDAQLPCVAVGSPKPNVTWFLNDSVLIKSAGRVQILDNGALLIAAVQPSDGGKYTCVRSNLMGSANSSGFLSVLVKTQIIQPPVDTKVILGHKASLLCRVSHDSMVPYDLKWYFDGKNVNPNNETRINIKSDGTLEIQEARNLDIGTYLCVVSSPGGDDSRSAKLDVIELPYQPTTVKAELVPNVPKAVNVSWLPGFDGKSTIKNFIIQKRVMRKDEPTPDPLVDWITVMTNVSSDQRYVVLTTLKPAMSYQFRISAVNSVGEGTPSLPSGRVTLPQEPPSAPPVGVVGSPRSSSSIMIQWQPPPEDDRNGELGGYVIKYNIYGYPEDWKNRTILNEAQRSYIIDGLITWQLYEIKMAAYNDKGVGVFSNSIHVRTKEGVPLEAPGMVRVEAKSSTVVQVWWKPPNPQMINGVNQGYKIQMWNGEIKLGVEPHRTVQVPPSTIDQEAEQTVNVDQLEKYKDYLVTVLCFTAPGDGKRSESVPVKTLQDVPDAVHSFTFENVKDKTVDVLWSPPQSTNGILLGYTLRYFIKDIPENIVMKNLSADTTQLQVTDLIPSTQYTFEIFGWTEIGPGPSRSSTIQSGVPPVLPHAPTKLSVSKVEAFSAYLQFTPGFNGNTSITKYIVQAQIGRNGSWVVIFENPSPDTPVIAVENLIPYMEYRLRLVANNIVGASPPSEPSRPFQTLQAPPSHPPRSVTVRAMSATALRVRWTPLPQIEWYGIPRGYNISYRVSKRNNTTKRKFYLLENHNANSYVIDNLEEYTEYEIAVEAYNDVGSSTPSPIAVETTRESVPGGGPENVTANATSSTTIVVNWGKVPENHENGILEGYKVSYGAKNIPYQYKDIPNNSTFTTTLTELKKYILYSVQVLAYTRMGDGLLSLPPITVRTFADVPGPPSNLSFPDVSVSMARMIWDIPDEPNGDILEYQVVVQHEETWRTLWNESLSSETRTYRATDLESETNYLFTITAKTEVGWGTTAKAVVYTSSNRKLPQPPSAPQISQSQIQSDEITFTWTPGSIGYAPLRYYTIQQADESAHWQVIPEKVDPALTSYTVKGLKPFTKYKFRIQATNDIGASEWSDETIFTRTLAGVPRDAPEFTNILPITPTEVKITWKSLSSDAWNGDVENGGYRIEYHQVTEYLTGRSPSKEIKDSSASEMTLSDLIRDQNYEFVILSVNSKGEGPKSKPQTIYVGEAVPTGQPLVVEAKAVSPTEVSLIWKPPPKNQQNGDLSGYKIFVGETIKPRESEEMEVVSDSTLEYTLIDLNMFTSYNISLLAFNPAGDGPRTKTMMVWTLEGLPGPPTNLTFSEITMNSLRVSWSPPVNPNGRVVGYLISYETTLPNEDFSKQVRRRVNGTTMPVDNLEEMSTYTFRVSALTIDSGPDLVGNVTTGTQIGSPEKVEKLTVITTSSAVILIWKNPSNDKIPITGYLIESKKDDEKWQRVIQLSEAPLLEWAVSYQNLLPSSSYKFRLFTMNKNGVSAPTETTELVVTPNKMIQEMAMLGKVPFYHEVWFLVALAAISVVIIILVIAVLCVKSKGYKYKRHVGDYFSFDPGLSMDENNPILCRKCGQEVGEESVKPSTPEKVGSEDAGFTTFELRQSRRNTLRKNTLSRKNARMSNGAVIAKPPPRPSPASITYSDEEDLKGYDDNCDSSSLTEKPSEISSTETEATESEPESEKSDPHSFVNHYANVNDTFRQSWKRQRPAKGYSSYTDSDPEGSVAVSLNGGHIILNNMAGSRAPLPGFSSFV